MADQQLTLAQLNEIFQMLTIHMLGMDNLVEPWETYDADPEAWPEFDAIPINPYEKVRISWPTGGAPAWKVTDDVVFLRIFEVDGPYNRQRDMEKSDDGEDINIAKSYTQIDSVHWIFYGPNSYANAQKVRRSILNQDNHDTLAANHLFAVLSIPAPIRVPESFMSQWWERVDFTMMFNEHVIINSTVKTIVEVPVTSTFESGDTQVDVIK